MNRSRSWLHVPLGLVATLGLVLGGAAVATAGTPAADDRTPGNQATIAPAGDVLAAPIDAQISEITGAAWVYAYERATVSVVVSGSAVPAGATVAIEVFDGPGARTCDPAVSEGWATMAATPGIVTDPGWTPYDVGYLGWRAELRTSAGAVLDSTGCFAQEIRAFFTDVPGTHPFFSAIQKLGVSGIAAGYQPGPQFRPAQAQSRQGMAVFLQRFFMEGEPAPACTTAPFTDVPKDHPFCAQIAWLKEWGIIGGYTDGSFRPAAAVTRQAGATIIARAKGMPEGTTCTAAPFPDVATGHPFCGPIAWLAAEGGVKGYPDGTFRPGALMTRQAMAAWLESSFLE